MNKTKNKSKVLKNTKSEAGFFRALIFGLAVCLAVWILLSLVFALVMSKQTDSNALGGVFSPIIAVVSLAVGGAVSAKMDKSCAVLSSFTLGTIVLGISYLLSSALSLSRGLGIVMKTLLIAVILISPVIGARLVTGRKKTKRTPRKRRM